MAIGVGVFFVFWLNFYRNFHCKFFLDFSLLWDPKIVCCPVKVPEPWSLLLFKVGELGDAVKDAILNKIHVKRHFLAKNEICWIIPFCEARHMPFGLCRVQSEQLRLLVPCCTTRIQFEELILRSRPTFLGLEKYDILLE